MKLLSKACAVTISCPAVYQDGDDLIIVGSYHLTDPQLAEMQSKIGAGECAVRISRALVEDALKTEFI